MESVDNSFDAECPVCKQFYDKSNRVNKVLPCSEGHVICLQCLEQLFNKPEPSEKCFLLGKYCSASRHASCPMCKDVFHLPNDDINLVVTFPSSEEAMVHFVKQRRELRRESFQKREKLLNLAEEIMKSLKELQKEVNDCHFNCNVARVSGAVPAVVGGVMFITGAALSLFTLGASAGLMVAGGALSGAGGITAGGASVAEMVINSKSKKKIDELVSLYQKEYEDLLELLHEYSIMNSVINVGLKFWLHSSVGVAHIGHGVGTVVGVVRLCLKAADLVQETAGSAYRLMAVSGKVFNILGVVGAGIMLPFDIISVVWNSYDIHKRTPAKLSEVIEKAISNIESSCVGLTDKIEKMLMELD